MSIGDGSIGGNYSGLVGTSTNVTWDHTTVVANETIYIVEWYVTGGATPTDSTNTVNVNGSTTGVSLVGSYVSSLGIVVVHKYKAATAATYAISVVPGTSEWYIASSVAKTGVGSEGTVQLGSATNATSASKAPTCGTGSEIVAIYGEWGGSSNITTATLGGGTNRVNIKNSNNNLLLDISDTTTSGTSFTISESHASSFYFLAFEVIPELSPGGDTIATTAGTPDVTAPKELDPGGTGFGVNVGLPEILQVDAGVILEQGLTVNFTPGSPGVTAPAIYSPGTNTLTIASSAPEVITNSFYPVLQKLANNQDVRIVVLGDSISYGFGDDNNTPFLHGWVGRFGQLLGAMYDVNVDIASWNDQVTIYGTFYPDAGQNGQFYDAPYSLHTSSRGGSACTVHMIDGASCSQSITYLNNSTRLPLLLPSPGTIDFLILASLVNDYSADHDTTSQYVSNYQAWLTHIQTLYSGPILVTNENKTNSGNESIFAAFSGAIFLALPGWPQVALMDTRSFYTNLATMVQASGVYSGVHPMAAGFAAQAEGMMSGLVPQYPSPGGVTVFATSGAPLVITPLTPHGATIATTAAKPGVTAPEVYYPGPTVIVETSGTPEVIQPIGGVKTTLTPGTPSVAAPQVYSPTGTEMDITTGDTNIYQVLTLTPAGISINFATNAADAIVDPNMHVFPGGTSIVTIPGRMVIPYNTIWFRGINGSLTGERTITAQQWADMIGDNGTYQDTTWNFLNGYSVPIHNFTPEQILILESDSEFIFGQSGQRPAQDFVSDPTMIPLA